MESCREDFDKGSTEAYIPFWSMSTGQGIPVEMQGAQSAVEGMS